MGELANGVGHGGNSGSKGLERMRLGDYGRLGSRMRNCL